MCIIPIMSDIRGIITANFDYAEGGSNLVNKYFTFARKFARIWIFFILLTPRLRSLFLVFSPISIFSSFTLLFHSHCQSLCISTCTAGFSLYLSPPIAFCIAHPQASVHYRKYWISIMKYWMISDIRRAADIVRNMYQYVLAFLAVYRRWARAERRRERRKLLCLW